ncbi:hypothetical protein Adt_12610 [Abeliophyllum distichum]|uniref:Uncharacterized protein n=1 Tax=Abeliophyllum distichum TaxID=126358 RepID=A0ABD1URG9_9LAMI
MAWASCNRRGEILPNSLDDLEEGDLCKGRRIPVSEIVRLWNIGICKQCWASYSNTNNREDNDWIYYSHRKSDVGQMSDQSIHPTSKCKILPWRKMKLSFGSPKVKGKPLLKKYYGEEGGDDIGFVRTTRGFLLRLLWWG